MRGWTRVAWCEANAGKQSALAALHSTQERERGQVAGIPEADRYWFPQLKVSMGTSLGVPDVNSRLSMSVAIGMDSTLTDPQGVHRHGRGQKSPELGVTSENSPRAKHGGIFQSMS